MTENQKNEIRALLDIYCNGYKSQAQAVANLRDVSESNIIAMRKGNWGNISENMWRNVGKQVGFNEKKRVQVDTLAFETLCLYFQLAKDEGVTFAITAPAGYGKSHGGEWYRDAMKGRNVYYLRCAEYLNQKYFLIRLIESMGKNPAGMNVNEMMAFIVSELRKQDQPLFILDEIDKLRDNVLMFFITLYNELNKMCGFVWTSTDSIEKRIKHGLRLGRPGYNELYRRIGRSFIELPKTDKNEVVALCAANGITDPETINKIWNEYNGDISRIDREEVKQRARQTLTRKKTA